MLIKELKKENPMLKQNIFNSIHNVCVDTLCEYKLDGTRHTFNEIFEDKK